MKLSELGEFELIDRIAKKHQKTSSTVVGIGDDAAVLKPQKKLQLVTTDTLVENVDFKRKELSFFYLGRKALLANISDISAMGGVPTSALITLGLPKKTNVADIDDIYDGLNSLAKKQKIDIIGGDTTDSKTIFISITLLGEVEKDDLLLRSGAKPGDLICVTGEFGGPAKSRFDSRKMNAECRTQEAQIIAKSHLANAMIDSSDGLARSILAICHASQVGARIWEDNVPIAARATLDQALYGGEEYELVFTVPERVVHQLKRVKYTIVGEVCRLELGVKLADKHDKIKSLKSGGYEHFKR